MGEYRLHTEYSIYAILVYEKLFIGLCLYKWKERDYLKLIVKDTGFKSKPFSGLCLYKWKETDVSATVQQFKATGGGFLRRFCGICAVFCGSRRTALIQATTS